MNPGLVITDLLGRVTTQPGYERRLRGLPIVVGLWGQTPDVAARPFLDLVISNATDFRDLTTVRTLTRGVHSLFAGRLRRDNRRPMDITVMDAKAPVAAYREMTGQTGRQQRGTIMLSDFTPVTTLAVRDLQAARNFYESVLGFAPGRDVGEGAFYTAGDSQFFIYESQYAGTNQATAMSFQLPADAFDTEVETLRTAGVTFETFDAPGVTWTDGVASMGDQMRGVWFKDPDGNILNIDTIQSSRTDRAV